MSASCMVPKIKDIAEPRITGPLRSAATKETPIAHDPGACCFEVRTCKLNFACLATSQLAHTCWGGGEGGRDGGGHVLMSS